MVTTVFLAGDQEGIAARPQSYRRWFRGHVFGGPSAASKRQLVAVAAGLDRGSALEWLAIGGFVGSVLRAGQCQAFSAGPQLDGDRIGRHVLVRPLAIHQGQPVAVTVGGLPDSTARQRLAIGGFVGSVLRASQRQAFSAGPQLDGDRIGSHVLHEPALVLERQPIHVAVGRCEHIAALKRGVARLVATVFLAGDREGVAARPQSYLRWFRGHVYGGPSAAIERQLVAVIVGLDRGSALEWLPVPRVPARLGRH